MRSSIARRPSRVTHHHGVAGAGVYLHLVEEFPSELRVWSAMNKKDHRMWPWPIRTHYPPVHKVAIWCGRRNLFHRRQPCTAEARTKGCYFTFILSSSHNHQLAGAGVTTDDGDHGRQVGTDRESIYLPISSDKRTWRT